MLKSKHRNTQEEWSGAWKAARSLVPFHEIDEKLNRAAEWLYQQTKDRKPFYGWSGGKDAVVMYEVCRRVGITNGVAGISNYDMEYPAVIEFIEKNKPEGCVIRCSSVTFEELEEKPQMTFPDSFQPTEWWADRVFRSAWDEYADKYGMDTYISGNRTKDGNFVGKNNYYWKGDLLKVNPIARLSHEEVFAAMQYFNLPTSPAYSWEKGFTRGTHSWIRRYTDEGMTKFDTMDEVMAIDPEIIPRHASKLSILRGYCDARGIEYQTK